MLRIHEKKMRQKLIIKENQMKIKEKGNCSNTFGYQAKSLKL